MMFGMMILKQINLIIIYRAKLLIFECRNADLRKFDAVNSGFDFV